VAIPDKDRSLFEKGRCSPHKNYFLKKEAKMAVDTEHQLVGFRLGAEEYAVEISRVQEIIRLPEITKIPKVPHFVEGVINLREKYYPLYLCEKNLIWRMSVK